MYDYIDITLLRSDEGREDALPFPCLSARSLLMQSRSITSHFSLLNLSAWLPSRSLLTELTNTEDAVMKKGDFDAIGAFIRVEIDVYPAIRIDPCVSK